MAELDLYDLLKLKECDLSQRSDGISVEIINSGGDSSSVLSGIPEEKNLITIAVKNYMNRIGAGGKFTFDVIKNIPSGAGLGGGSSNAASALMIVSEFLGRGVDDDLRAAAAASGSDVPFFLEGGFAFIEGRGEYVSPIDYSDESFIILINNGIHIDTGTAYQSLKKPVSAETINCDERRQKIIRNISLKSAWRDMFKNDFEQSVFKIHPQLALLKEKMYKNGAFFSSMTGSGSTIFSLFENEHMAENAYKMLINEGNRAYFTKFRRIKN